MALVQVEYTEGDPETYVLLLAFASAEAEAAAVEQHEPRAVMARLKTLDGTGILYSALADRSFAEALLEAVARRRRFKGTEGNILALPTATFNSIREPMTEPLNASVMRAEQSNTSIVYGDRMILKLFRRVQEGINPEAEITAFLTERSSFSNFPRLAGTRGRTRARRVLT